MTRPYDRRRPLWTSCVAVVAALAGMLPAAVASADNPYDARQREHAGQVREAGGAAEGVLPLLELWRSWDEATPEVTMAQLDALAEAERLPPARRAYVRALRARGRLRRGHPEDAAREIAELGYLTQWRVVGPFDNEGKAGFDREMPVEARRFEPVDPDAQWPGKERPVGWRKWPGRTHYGYISFDAIFRPRSHVCGFAQTFVHSDAPRPLTLWLGNGGASKVWWNGERVLRDDRYRHPDPDRHVVAVGAHEGPNRLRVKVCTADGPWGFYLRVGGPRGGPAPEGVHADIAQTEATLEQAASLREMTPKQRLDPTALPDVARTRKTRVPEAPQAPLHALEAEVESKDGGKPDPEAVENLAGFLEYTGADDPSQRRAHQLAVRAAKLEPTVDRLAFAASTSQQRGERMRFVRQAKELAPDDPRVTLMRIRLLRSGPTPEEALPLLDELPDEGILAMRALRLRTRILRQLDLTTAALRVIAQATDRAPEAPHWLREHAEAARAAGRHDTRIALRRRAVKARYDDYASRRTLISDALHRGKERVVMRHVGILYDLASTPRELRSLASTYESLGRRADALEALKQAHTWAPHDAEVLVAQGRLLLRMGQPQAAATTFRDALALRPQDPETRELLAQIRPREQIDQQYAVERDTLRSRRVDEAGYPTTVLEDLTVNRVYENGLGSRFRQLAVQIHDEEGARRWRTYSIRFDPGSQRARVTQARVYRDGRTLEARRTFERKLGQPEYRIYYDTRARVVVFPDLQPGDVVDIRYRIDDVAHRNKFDDYFGDLAFLQGFEPTVRQDYVLITPPSRTFYVNDPELEALRHQRRKKNGRRVDHYWAEDVPALEEEPRMPGMTEVAPYLHVSTYETWNQVGQWYWGLIKDQLYADESLQEQVDQLVGETSDLRTKVERIHNWVVKNTRYVALEFGIHGFKPYRVPQVVRRGFGDCKDKASLMYTMFREAGIESDIVLVRTRDNGRIESKPASLAVFDHAIAYVPELDLYLDGTAENHGTGELPVQDQGVTVLHVGPGDVELRQTPVLPAERNERTREMDIRLFADGSADIEVDNTTRGPEAAGYRRHYEAERTREDRFERSMRSTFPGMRLESLEFAQLADLEKPVRFHYRAHVPQLAPVDGDTLRVAPTVQQNLVRNLARTPKRDHPLDLGGTRAYAEERTVRLRAGLQLDRVPDGGTAESRFGELTLSFERTDEGVRAHTELEIRADRIAPEDYPDFRQWVQQADALLRQRIVVKRTSKP